MAYMKMWDLAAISSDDFLMKKCVCLFHSAASCLWHKVCHRKIAIQNVPQQIWQGKKS